MHDCWSKELEKEPEFIYVFVTRFVKFLVSHLGFANDITTERLLGKDYISSIVRNLEYSHYEVFTYPIGNRS